MFCKEGPCKVDQIRNNPVVGIGPKTGKLKAVAGLFLFLLAALGILDGIPASAVGVVLGIGSVGDNENLSIFKQTTTGPEGIPLVTVDLIEGLTDGNTSALQFDMNQREPINEDGNVIAVAVLGTFLFADGILVDDLKPVVMNVLLIDERNVLGRTIITLQNLNIILLDFTGLFCNAVIRICNAIREEAFPFGIGKMIVVQLLQFFAEVTDQVCFSMNGQVLIALFAEKANEFLLQLSFTLVAVRTCLDRLIFGNNRVFTCLCDNVKVRHLFHSLLKYCYIHEVKLLSIFRIITQGT